MGRRARDIPWLAWHENGVAYVNWYDVASGRSRRQSLKTVDPDEAQRRYAEFLINGPVIERSALTVSQALDDYVRQHVEAKDDRGRSIVSDPSRQLIAVRHLKSWFRNVPIEAIGPAESRAYVEARRRGDIGGGSRTRTKVGSDATIRREMVTLVAAFNHAVKWGKVSAQCRIELPRVENRKQVEFFPKDQVAYMLRTAQGDLRAFIEIAYYTAARRAAVENLLVSQVDLKRGTIDLMPPNERRTKKRRPIVPIYPQIRPTIERLLIKSPSNLLFGSTRSFYRPFVEHLADIGLSGHPHMLRHSRASHMLMDGEGIYKVARLLGDTVATVERVYGHVLPDYLHTESAV